MTELKLINLEKLNHSQIDKVAVLLFETGYYENISLDNKLDLAPMPFQIEQTLRPCAKYTKALVNSQEEIRGFFIGATRGQVIELKEKVPNWYSDSFEVRVFQKKLFHFYIYETKPNDFILHEIAIDAPWRGKGLFRLLHQEIHSIAVQHKCRKIMFVVWESKPALDIYLHCGAKVVGEIDLMHLGFKDRLLKCCFEI